MIYVKLLQIQKKELTVKKKGRNPHFQSSYATLNEVLEKVKGPLNELGVLILQLPEKEGLKTILYDTEDKSQVECFMPYVEITTAQKLGSNNTYNRRYSLVTILGLEDEDDDGNVASGSYGGKSRATGQIGASTGGRNKITDKQISFIKSLWLQKGVKPISDEELTAKTSYQAKQYIEKLLKLPDKVKTNSEIKAQDALDHDLGLDEDVLKDIDVPTKYE